MTASVLCVSLPASQLWLRLHRDHPGRLYDLNEAESQPASRNNGSTPGPTAAIPDNSGEAAASEARLPLWVWWEFEELPAPGFVEACRESWKQRSGPRSGFDLRLVSRKKARKVLPDLPQEFDVLPPHVPTISSEIVRAGLIATYGGLFLSSDILLQGNLTWLFSLLTAKRGTAGAVDAVAHAEQGQDCQKGTFSTELFAGVKGNRLAAEWYAEAKQALSSACASAAAAAAAAAKVRTTPPSSQAGRGSRRPRQEEWCTALKGGDLGEQIAVPVMRRLLAQAPGFRVACLSEDQGFSEGLSRCGSTCLSALLQPEVPPSDLPRLLERFAYHVDRSSTPWRLQRQSLGELLRGRAVVSEIIRRSLGKRSRSQVFGGRISLCWNQAKPPKAPPRGERTFKPLEFIHIPRTGGTSIEFCSRTEMHDSERWGRENDELREMKLKDGTKPPCVGQHLPPSMVPFYDDKETFCVIRDPYDRLISVFGFQQGTWHGNQRCDAESLNQDLLTWLAKVSGMDGTTPDPYMFDCHMLPQAAWVHGWDASRKVVDPTKKNCGHALRFGRRGSRGGDDLGKQFDELMGAHGYPYRLAEPSLQKQARKAPNGAALGNTQASHVSCASLTKADLWPRTREMIRKVYHDDFRLLGFDEGD